MRSTGYNEHMLSPYMDSPRLLNLTLNMTPEQLSDWRTFEQVRSLLKDVHLDFALRPISAGR